MSRSKRSTSIGVFGATCFESPEANTGFPSGVYTAGSWRGAMVMP